MWAEQASGISDMLPENEVNLKCMLSRTHDRMVMPLSKSNFRVNIFGLNGVNQGVKRKMGIPRDANGFRPKMEIGLPVHIFA